MNEKARHNVMKFLALAGIFASLYPAVMISRVLLYGNDGGAAGFALYSLLLAAGFLAGTAIVRDESVLIRKLIALPAVDFVLYMINKKATVRSISSIAAYATLVIPLAAAAAIHMGDGIFRLVYEVPLALFFYLTGLRSSFKQFYEMLSDRRIYTGVFFITASLLTAFYHKGCNYLQTTVFAFAYTLAVASLLIKNQVSLDFNVFIRKHRGNSGVPGDIRRFNMIAVIMLFTLVLLLFNFKDIVLFLFSITGIVLRFIIKLYLWIVALLMPAPIEGEQKRGELQPAPELPEADNTGNPLFDLIAQLIAGIIIIYILYRAAPLIIRKAKALLLLLVKLLRKLLGKLPEVEDGAAVDYDDEVETIKPQEHDKNTGRKKAGPVFKRKDLKKITDPVEKVRHIYCMILELLVKRSVKVEKSDTTGEILVKALKVEGMGKPAKEITKIYEYVRYGGKVPGIDEVSEAETSYVEAVRAIDRKHK